MPASPTLPPRHFFQQRANARAHQRVVIASMTRIGLTELLSWGFRFGTVEFAIQREPGVDFGACPGTTTPSNRFASYWPMTTRWCARIRALLEKNAGVEVVGEAGDGASADLVKIQGRMWF